MSLVLVRLTVYVQLNVVHANVLILLVRTSHLNRWYVLLMIARMSRSIPRVSSGRRWRRRSVSWAREEQVYTNAWENNEREQTQGENHIKGYFVACFSGCDSQPEHDSHQQQRETGRKACELSTSLRFLKIQSLILKFNFCPAESWDLQERNFRILSF